jgi:hypothetical protein
MPFASVNWIAILAAAVAAWLFGALYYGLLGKAWLAALGTTAETLKLANAGKSAAAKAAPFVLSLVAEFVMAFVLNGILIHLNMFTVRAGMIAGAFCWIGFIMTSMTVNNAYPGRRAMLSVIDGGHWLGVMLIIGAVLGGIGR